MKIRCESVYVENLRMPGDLTHEVILGVGTTIWCRTGMCRPNEWIFIICFPRNGWVLITCVHVPGYGSPFSHISLDMGPVFFIIISYIFDHLSFPWEPFLV